MKTKIFFGFILEAFILRTRRKITKSFKITRVERRRK
jgi:hypothetical protein